MSSSQGRLWYQLYHSTRFYFILRTRRAIGVQGPCPFVFLDFHWILLGFSLLKGPFSDFSLDFAGFSLFKGPFSGSRFLIGLSDGRTRCHRSSGQCCASFVSCCSLLSAFGV